MKTQVGALSGPDYGITEHGRLPPNFLRPLSKPLFDQEAMPRRVRESGLEILGPVKAGKNKGRYVMRASRFIWTRPPAENKSRRMRSHRRQ